jgi:hypothetical protein
MEYYCQDTVITVPNPGKIGQAMSGKVLKEICRYHNHVNSLMNKEGWTTDEESLLLELHNEVGNKWVEIGRKLKR